MEGVRVGGVHILVAVAPPDDGDSNGQAAFAALELLEDAPLNRSGLRAQQVAWRDMERVLLVHRRVVVGVVERAKVVFEPLQVVAVHEFEAQPCQRALDPLHGQGQRMQACGAQRRARQGDVHSLGFDALGEFCLLQRRASLSEESLQMLAGGVHLLPELGSLFGGQRTQLAQQLPIAPLRPR
jgi:hypothetical protein